MEIDYNALGARVRELRKEKGLKQSVLAEQVQIETSNISHIERGVSKVSLGTLVRIALALGVTVDDLLCYDFPYERTAYENDVTRELADCSPKELRLIAGVVKSVKVSLRKEGYDG